MDWPKILLLTEVGLDDAVRNDNKSFTVKVHRSVNISPKDPQELVFSVISKSKQCWYSRI